MKKTASHRKRHGSSVPTTKLAALVVADILNEVKRKFADQPTVIMAAWPLIIGEKLAPFTKAISFCNGILTVEVRNSTLYGLLTREDKPRLIQLLKQKFPQTFIKTITFRPC